MIPTSTRTSEKHFFPELKLYRSHFYWPVIHEKPPRRYFLFIICLILMPDIKITFCGHCIAKSITFSGQQIFGFTVTNYAKDDKHSDHYDQHGHSLFLAARKKNKLIWRWHGLFSSFCFVALPGKLTRVVLVLSIAAVFYHPGNHAALGAVVLYLDKRCILVGIWHWQEKKFWDVVSKPENMSSLKV